MNFVLSVSSYMIRYLIFLPLIFLSTQTPRTAFTVYVKPGVQKIFYAGESKSHVSRKLGTMPMLKESSTPAQSTIATYCDRCDGGSEILMYMFYFTKNNLDSVRTGTAISVW